MPNGSALRVEACVVTYRNKPVGVTVSIDCAEYHESEGEQSDLLDRADAEIYEAKESGGTPFVGEASSLPSEPERQGAVERAVNVRR